MADQPTTRLAAGGHRFLVRRMEHALVRRDTAMHDDPLRAQSLSLAAGCVVAVIAVAACAILALVRPQGALGDAPIVMARGTGALYVRVGDTLHPVPNLVSARLIAASAADPVTVGDTTVAGAKRGPAMGIPGAPAVIGAPLTAPSWLVCDTDRTIVIVGADASTTDRLDDSRSVLVTPRGEGPATTYLLHDGRRAEVDLRNPPVVRALRLEGVAPVPVSRALLDTLPEDPAIAAPAVDGVGGPGPPALAGIPVGAIVRVVRADSIDYYAVLRDGVQRISEVAADLIRFTYPVGLGEVPAVAPSAIALSRAVDSLAVEHLPQRARQPLGADGSTAVCVHWHSDQASGRSSSAVLIGKLAVDRTTSLAQADGAGPNVDGVVVPPGHSVNAMATAIGGGGVTGPRYLVSDMGVRYGIRDDAVANHLGLSGLPAPAPWPILAALPRGPELSTEAASVFRDGWSPPS